MISTVDFQWFEHHWNHQNMFETGVVRTNERLSLHQVRKHNRDIFSIFFYLNVCCGFSLESPHRGDSNENTQFTIFNIKKKIILYNPKSAATGFCSNGLKNEFETAVVNEPSVFAPLKFYCICCNISMESPRRFQLDAITYI